MNSPFDIDEKPKHTPESDDVPIEHYDREPEAHRSNGNGKPKSTEYSLEKGLPWSPEAEKAILAGILLDNRMYGEIADQLEVEHFCLDAHRRIYTRVRQLLDAAKPCDMVTLVTALDEKKEIEAIGGVAYLSSLIDGVPERPSLKHYVDIVRSRAKLRGMINIAQTAISEAMENVSEAEEVIDRAETAILQLRADTVGTSRAMKIGDYHQEGMREVLRTVDLASTRKVVGFTYGLSELDEITTGARAGEVTLIAARPGHGKSVFAEQMALANAADGVKTAYFSHEMQKLDIFQRALCHRTRINYLKIRSGQLTTKDLEALASESKTFDDLPLWIDDTPKLSLTQVLARARMLLSEGVQLYIFDFVQKIRVPGQGDMRLRLNDVSDGITSFAKEHAKLGVHCVMLSQLAKFKGEKETAPTENDIKETGNLFEDAHVCALLYRPRDKNRMPTGLDSLNVAKQRNGPTGPMGAKLVGHEMRWEWRELKKPVESVKEDDKQAKLIEERDRTGEKKEA